ncbi:hypothetical protein Tco_1212709 [Tanacetum coccineum]
MCTYLKNMEGNKPKDLKNKSFVSIQKMFDKAFKRVNTFVDFRANLVEVDDDQEAIKIKELMEIDLDEEEVAINVIPLAAKPPSIVDWKIHKEGKKSYYQMSQIYLVFSHMLKNFDREDLETLWKLVKAKHGSTRPEEGYERVLLGNLKVMFEPHVEDIVWRNQQDYRVLEWKLYDSCGVHFLRMQHMQIYMLVENKYHLTPATITDMLNKKLQCDHFSEMAYQLLKSMTKQYKVNAAEGVNAASEEVSTAELVSTAYVIYLLKWDPTRGILQLGQQDLPFIGGGGGFMVLGGGKECLEGCVGAVGGEVNGGGDEFGVSKSLLGEIPRVVIGESGGVIFGDGFVEPFDAYDEPIGDLDMMEDKVDNPSPQSAPQVLPLFEEYTLPVAYLEEVEETLGTPMKVEPLKETQLEDLGWNTCNHDIPLSFREVPIFDEPEPQPQPLPNCPSLNASLGNKRGPEPPIKPHSPDSFRIKEVDHLTIHTPPLPHVASFHPKNTYCYYHPCIGNPKKHYRFKPGLLGHSGSLGVDVLKLEMIEDDWELEPK